MRNIKFSRHAKRRIKLYHIPEDVINKVLSKENWAEGHHEIVRDIEGLTLPIKIVFDVKSTLIVVITAYPLKKRKI